MALVLVPDVILIGLDILDMRKVNRRIRDEAKSEFGKNPMEVYLSLI